MLGIEARRPLPPYAEERFDHWFAQHVNKRRPTRGKVILWDDTFVRYHEPNIGRAAVAVLEAAGFEVVLPNHRKCCGRPAFSQGNLDEAAKLGRHNLELLSKDSKQYADSFPGAFVLLDVCGGLSRVEIGECGSGCETVSSCLSNLLRIC